MTYSSFDDTYATNTEKTAFLVPENATEMAFVATAPDSSTQWIITGYDDADQSATVVGMKDGANVANVTLTKAGNTLVYSNTNQQNAVNMRTNVKAHTYKQGGKYKVAKEDNLVKFYYHDGNDYVEWFNIDTTKTPTANTGTLTHKTVRFGMLGGVSAVGGNTLLQDVQILK